MGPMIASRLLRASEAHHHGGMIGAIGRGLASIYRVTLRVALRNPFVVVLIALLFAASSYFVYGQLRQEITPPEDRSQIQLRVQAPTTASLDYIRTQLTRVESMLQPFVDSGEVQLDLRALRLGQRRLADPDAGALGRARPQPAADRQRHQHPDGAGARRARLGRPGQQPGHPRRRLRPAVRRGRLGLYAVLADTANQISELLAGRRPLRPRHASTSTPPSPSSP
jgi:hypothetical protein